MALTPTEAAAISAFLELALKVGLTTAIEWMTTLQNKNPTAEQIRALDLRVPHPDTYEKGG